MNDKPIGRPRELTSEVAAEIFARIADGKSLSQATRDGTLPSCRTVLRVVACDAQLRAQYAFACQIREQRLFDEITEIADSAKTAEEAQIARVRIEARRWALAKMNPKKYADNNKPEVNVSTSVTNNFPVITEERQRAIQARTKQLLEGLSEQSREKTEAET